MIQIKEDILYQFIGDQIRTLRRKKKISQLILGEQLGLERTSITNIELGNQKPPILTIYKICAYFGVTLQDFLPEIASVIRDNSNEEGIIEEKVTIGGKTQTVTPKTAALLHRLIDN